MKAPAPPLTPLIQATHSECVTMRLKAGFVAVDLTLGQYNSFGRPVVWKDGYDLGKQNSCFFSFCFYFPFLSGEQNSTLLGCIRLCLYVTIPIISSFQYLNNFSLSHCHYSSQSMVREII